MARKREFDEVEALNKAMQLFWLQGYEKTSMDDLVNHMGVHRKSIYDTFGNKHALFLKVLAYYETTIAQQLLETISKENTAEDKLKAIFELSLQSNHDKAKGCLVVNTGVELSPHDSAIAQIIRSNFEETEKIIYQLLQEGQTSGAFSHDLELSVATKFVHNTLIGFRVQLKTSEDHHALKPIVDMTMQVLKGYKK